MTFSLIKTEINEWAKCLIRYLPGKFGFIIRKRFWSGRFKTCGSIELLEGCFITAPQNISIGAGVKVLNGCCLLAHNSGCIEIDDCVTINNGGVIGATDNGIIKIGKNVLLGFNVVIRASNHYYKKKAVAIKNQGHSGGKVIIEDDVWIGANAVVLPNVIIGKGSVVGAGSIVNRDIPAYSLAAGNPAKIIKENIRI